MQESNDGDSALFDSWSNPYPGVLQVPDDHKHSDRGAWEVYDNLPEYTPQKSTHDFKASSIVKQAAKVKAWMRQGRFGIDLRFRRPINAFNDEVTEVRLEPAENAPDLQLFSPGEPFARHTDATSLPMSSGSEHSYAEYNASAVNPFIHDGPYGRVELPAQPSRSSFLSTMRAELPAGEHRARSELSSEPSFAPFDFNLIRPSSPIQLETSAISSTPLVSKLHSTARLTRSSLDNGRLSSTGVSNSLPPSLRVRPSISPSPDLLPRLTAPPSILSVEDERMTDVAGAKNETPSPTEHDGVGVIQDTPSANKPDKEEHATKSEVVSLQESFREVEKRQAEREKLITEQAQTIKEAILSLRSWSDERSTSDVHSLIRPIVLRGLRVAQSATYQTDTDVEPASSVDDQVRRVSPLRARKSAAWPRKKRGSNLDQKPRQRRLNDETSNFDTDGSSNALTRRQTMHEPASADDGVEKVWQGLLKLQANILGFENHLRLQAKADFARSRAHGHSEKIPDILDALRQSGKRARRELGRSHPKVSKFSADLHTLSELLDINLSDDDTSNQSEQSPVSPSHSGQPPSPQSPHGSDDATGSPSGSPTTRNASSKTIAFVDTASRAEIVESDETSSDSSPQSSPVLEVNEGRAQLSQESSGADSASAQVAVPSDATESTSSTYQDVSRAPTGPPSMPQVSDETDNVQIQAGEPVARNIVPGTMTYDEMHMAFLAASHQPGSPMSPVTERVLPAEISTLYNTRLPPHKPRNRFMVFAGLVFDSCTKLAFCGIQWLTVNFGPEQEVRPGHVRVRWTCSCGEPLYDDFVERRPGAARELEAYLNRPRTQGGPASTVNAGNFMNPQEPNSPASPSGPFNPSNSTAQTRNASSSVQPPLTQPFWPSAGHPSQINPYGTHAGGTTPPGTLGFMPTLQYTAPPQEIPWLLTCAIEDHHTTKLAHLDASKPVMRSDKDLALALRQHHFDVNKKWWRTFRLRGLSSMEFVQFEVHQNRFCDVRKVPDLPPPALQGNSTAQYDFEMGDLNPPVGSQYLVHLFRHPEDYDGEEIAYRRMPKRHGRLSRGVGWGIHMREGFDAGRVWSLICTLFVLGSLVFAIAWTSLKHDIQGAFGVAAWTLSLAALGVGWLQATLG